MKPRGIWALLLDRDFGGLFWGKLLSFAAIWIHGIVAALIAYSATGSTLAVAFVSAAQFAPQLLLSPIAGGWADRRGAQQPILFGRSCCVIGSGGTAVWVLFREDLNGWPEVWPILAGSLVAGIGMATSGPALQALVPLMVSPQELGSAMVLNTAPMTLGRVLGPSLGAVAAAQLGPAAALGCAAFGHLALGVIIALIRLPEVAPRESTTDYSVRAALRFVAADRSLVRLLVIVTCLGVASEPSLTLAPALADRLGGASGVVGAMTGAFGGGAFLALVAGAVVNRGSRRDELLSTAGMALTAIGLCAAAVGNLAIALTGFAIAGAGFTLAMTSASTLLQVRVPVVLRGRLMALWVLCFVGSRPTAALAMGALADLTAVHVAMLATALLAGVVTVLCRPARL